MLMGAVSKVVDMIERFFQAVSRVAVMQRIPRLGHQERLPTCFVECTAVIEAIIDQQCVGSGSNVLAGRDGVLAPHPFGKVLVNPFQLSRKAIGVLGRRRSNEDVLAANKPFTLLQKPWELRRLGGGGPDLAGNGLPEVWCCPVVLRWMEEVGCGDNVVATCNREPTVVHRIDTATDVLETIHRHLVAHVIQVKEDSTNHLIAFFPSVLSALLAAA